MSSQCRDDSDNLSDIVSGSILLTDFTDVAEGFWAYRYIEYAQEHGVVQGYSDGRYQPEQTVTRDQMAVYVQRAFGLEESGPPVIPHGVIPSASQYASCHPEGNVVLTEGSRCRERVSAHTVP